MCVRVRVCVCVQPITLICTFTQNALRNVQQVIFYVIQQSDLSFLLTGQLSKSRCLPSCNLLIKCFSKVLIRGSSSEKQECLTTCRLCKASLPPEVQHKGAEGACFHACATKTSHLKFHPNETYKTFSSPVLPPQAAWRSRPSLSPSNQKR